MVASVEVKPSAGVRRYASRTPGPYEHAVTTPGFTRAAGCFTRLRWVDGLCSAPDAPTPTTAWAYHWAVHVCTRAGVLVSTCAVVRPCTHQP